MIDKELTLKELRVKYPNIKATSKAKFLQLVDEQEVVDILDNAISGIIEEINPDLVELNRIKYESIRERMNHYDYVKVCELHAKYFNHKYRLLCKCKGSKILQWLDELIKKLS